MITRLKEDPTVDPEVVKAIMIQKKEKAQASQGFSYDYADLLSWQNVHLDTDYEKSSYDENDHSINPNFQTSIYNTKQDQDCQTFDPKPEYDFFPGMHLRFFLPAPKVVVGWATLVVEDYQEEGQAVSSTGCSFSEQISLNGEGVHATAAGTGGYKINAVSTAFVRELKSDVE